MGIGFDNIYDHVIPMEDFALKWRFTDENHDKLLQLHLDQLKPLDQQASEFLSNFLVKTSLHQDFPFKHDFFRNIDKVEILEGNEKEIKKWLYQRGLAFDMEVFLSWGSSVSMIVPWKLLIRYFDTFYYVSSDDLTVFDQSLNWALLFFHADEIYFGTNKDFLPSELYQHIDFIW
jgi:hypothetical protein